MTALIGVTSVWSVETKGPEQETPEGYFYNPTSYSNSLLLSGGVPVIITPVVTEASEIKLQKYVEALLNKLSGLYLSGGGGTKLFKAPDMPGLQTQQPLRYRFEELLIKEAWQRKMPVIGACRGHQTMTEVLGGSIKPETVEGHQQKREDRVFHQIQITAGSKLEEITGLKNWQVNSLHCQVAETAPPGFLVSARSPEGYIEAIEAEGPVFWAGFQFHPEIMYAFDAAARKIIDAFCRAANDYQPHA